MSLFVIVFSWLVVKELGQHRLNRTLIAAVKKGDTPTVLASLARGADPNARDNKDLTISEILISSSALR